MNIGREETRYEIYTWQDDAPYEVICNTDSEQEIYAVVESEAKRGVLTVAYDLVSGDLVEFGRTDPRQALWAVDRGITGEIKDGWVTPGDTAQGFVYKNPTAFYNNQVSEISNDEICYIPEHGFDDATCISGKYKLDECDVYTYQDILDDCAGNKAIAALVFEAIDWQAPSSYFTEMDDEELAEFISTDINASPPSLSSEAKDAREASQQLNNDQQSAPGLNTPEL